MADPLHNEPNDLRDELLEILDDAVTNECTLCTLSALDEIEKVFEARFKQAKAEAWDEGRDAGQYNEHEFRPGKQLVNPYREES